MKILMLVLIFSGLVVDMSAQKITITGKVTDTYKNPVSGALIMIDGKTTTTKTNAEGFYKVKVNPTASHIGVFTTIAGVKEEPVQGRTIINFTLGTFMSLQPDTLPVVKNEDVINEGYGTAKKSDKTKPVTQSDVSGNQFASFSTIYEILRTVPGVMVSGTTVSVRGVGTTGTASPLFVVNGITVSSISAINPSTVKSIEVLKGPAASVYGLQGANGVILIQLK